MGTHWQPINLLALKDTIWMSRIPLDGTLNAEEWMHWMHVYIAVDVVKALIKTNLLHMCCLCNYSKSMDSFENILTLSGRRAGIQNRMPSSSTHCMTALAIVNNHSHQGPEHDTTGTVSLTNTVQ